MHPAVSSLSAQPIESIKQLAQRFVDASKPLENRRIGVEHEKLLVHRTGPRALLAPEYPLIATMLGELSASTPFSDSPITEDGHTIGLRLARGGTVTLEPGGQMEHSSAPRATLAEAIADNDAHLDALLACAARHDLAPLALGFRPFGSRDDVPWMPKGRYEVMRNYLPTRGTRGLDMMKRTTTVQANFDWTSEERAMDALRTAFGIGPIVTALFAASPLSDGKLTGMQSTRAYAWLDTDPDRCGLLPFVFTPTARFEDYVEWAMRVPMFFLKRDDHYRPLHMPFGQFWQQGYHDERANLDDWELHLSTLFPQVRLRSYLEVRQADASTRELARALPALWLGVLYDEASLKAAYALVASLSFAERLALEEAAARDGLRATAGGRTLHDLGRELVAIAQEGLGRVDPTSVPLLAPLHTIVATGRTRADEIVSLYQTHGATERLVEALRLS